MVFKQRQGVGVAEGKGGERRGNEGGAAVAVTGGRGSSARKYVDLGPARSSTESDQKGLEEISVVDYTFIDDAHRMAVVLLL